MATYVENLTSTRDNTASVMATETAYWVTNGPKPSYSLDGESVSWDQWLTNMQAVLDKLDKQIAGLDDPYEHSATWYT